MTPHLNETMHGMGLAHSLTHGKALMHAVLFDSNTLAHHSSLALFHSSGPSLNATSSEKLCLTTVSRSVFSFVELIAV